MALQFHNARASVGHPARAAQGRDALRLLAVPMMPWLRPCRWAWVARTRDLPTGLLFRTLPWALLLFHAKGAGELAAYLAGPGDSARKVQ